LKEARDEVDKLKKEDLGSRMKLKEMLKMYHDIIDKAIFLAKIFFPLHRQLKNLYMENKTHQDEIRKLGN
jgi:hypothetical protein